MSENMDSDYEPEGLTLGPEERLEREIARIKALKVERLQLRDRVARLESQVAGLVRENELLKERLGQSGRDLRETSPGGPETEATCITCAESWTWGLVASALIAAALLSYYWFAG